MARGTLSNDSLIEATRYRAQRSRHGNAIGAAGYSSENEVGAFLNRTGEIAIVDPQDHAFGEIRIGAAWDRILVPRRSLWGRLTNSVRAKPVDMDLGCLYELQDGTRGVIQPFGKHFGHYDHAPYIALSGDERTGDSDGHDEYIRVNGAQWPAIKRLILYVYIYKGVPHWGQLKPEITVNVPGQKAFVAQPAVHDSRLSVCVVAALENVRNGIKLENHTEYFPGHAEMDRAFGFGLSWADGAKKTS